MKLLMVDNYDSFTYNLVQYFGELGADVQVVRNDEIPSKRLMTLPPTKSCSHRGLAPQRKSGISIPTLLRFAGKNSHIGRMPWASIHPGRRSAARSSAPKKSCTAKPRKYTTRVSAYSPACPARLKPRATIRW